MKGTVYCGGGVTSGSFGDDARLYSYRPGVDTKWTVIDTPTYHYALTEYDSQLLLVGGEEFPADEVTNKIFTLRDGEFVEMLLPMREKRHSACAVSWESALFVAGGEDAFGELSTSVEVFKDGVWMTAPSLPTAGSNMKSTLHGDQWFLINGLTKAIFQVSLQNLITSTKSPWTTQTQLAALNVHSAFTFFSGYFLSIGGGWHHSTTSSIHAFSSISQSWELVDDLPVPLSNLSAAILPTGELVIVGGYDQNELSSDRVYLASVKGLLFSDCLSQEYMHS